MAYRTDKKYLSGASLLLLAWGACLSHASAQSADAPAAPAADVSQGPSDNANQSGAPVEEIVVTANKRSETINHVGLTITAIGGAALQQRSLASLQDLAEAVPGLTFTPSEANTPVYTLRGVGFYETSLASYPDVSVYLDEVPLPFPVLSTLTLFDLDHVEVLKGPQGTLFGNNATGGAINYIAAKPSNDLSAGGSVSFGRFNTTKVDGFVSGPVTDTLSARAAVSGTKGDGWQNSLTRPGDTNGAPDSLAARFLADWQATDDLRFQLNLNGWRDRSQPPAAQFLKFVPLFPTPSPIAHSPISPDDPQSADWAPNFTPSANNRLGQIALRADYDLTPEIKLTSLTSYIDYSRSQISDGGSGVSFDRVDLVDSGYIRSFSQELRVSNGSNGDFRWIAGANYENDNVYENDFVDYANGTAHVAFGGALGNGYDSKQEMENYAVFGNTEYDIDQFTLKAGVRLTEADRRTRSCTFGRDDALDGGYSQTAAVLAALSTELSGTFTPVPGAFQCFELNPKTEKPAPFNATLNQNNAAWRAGVDWKPLDNFLGYINISKGYKAGSFPTLSASNWNAPAAVTQESVLDYEVGFKTQLFGGRVSLNGAGFYYDYTNKQLKGKIIDPTFGPLDALVNIPKSSVRGAEMEVQTRPLQGLSVGFAATYLDATIDNFIGVSEAGQVSNFNGTAVPYTPRWQLSANVNYSFPLVDQFTGFVGGQVNYRASSTASIGSPAAFALPAYTLLDLQAGVETDNGWRFMLWGKNVTNEFYITNVLQYTDGRSRYVGMPATYGMTLSYRY